MNASRFSCCFSFFFSLGSGSDSSPRISVAYLISVREARTGIPGVAPTYRNIDSSSDVEMLDCLLLDCELSPCQFN
jgi:hypothetical protein